jgi:hypothetical protein
VDAGNLCVIHADGSGKKQLTRFGTDRSPAWSRDGTKLVFIRTPKDHAAPSAVYVISADGKGERRLSGEGPGDCRTPLWSPVRDEIVYLRNRWDGAVTPGSYVEFVTPQGKPAGKPFLYLEGSSPDSPTAEELCDWSAEGTRLSVLVMGYLYFDVEILRRERGQFTRASAYAHRVDQQGQVDYVYHGWCPANPGFVLLVEHTFAPGAAEMVRNEVVVATEEVGDRRPHVVGKSGAEQGMPLHAVWSPDGNWLCYEDEGRLYLTNVEHPQPRFLTAGSMPRWTR